MNSKVSTVQSYLSSTAIYVFQNVKMKNFNVCYTCDITPNPVTSGVAHLCDLAPGQHTSEEMFQRRRAVGNT